MKEDKEPKEQKERKEKVVNYYIAPKEDGRPRHGIELPGFLDGYGIITNDKLNGRKSEALIRAIQNYENETGTKIIGELILIK